jgi:feruloyl esterase
MAQLNRLLVSVALLVSGAATSAFAARSCDSLISAPIKDGAILSAKVVAAGQFAGSNDVPEKVKSIFPTLPAFCRVQARLTPSSDSDIRIEVWMPLSAWNGKLLEGGNAAFSPALSYRTMSEALRVGYAATSSNTGHEENSARFALGHPEKLIDFGYRAVHVNIVAAKEIVTAFYGNPASKSYFEGCSTGGRQGYGEAQRYPEDFDGIVAGAPGINFTHQTGAELWNVSQVNKDPASFISQDKLMMLHDAVVQACDQLDGVKDGVIEDPLRCHFDPDKLLCKGEDTPNCLTVPQLNLVHKLYTGPVSPRGEQIFPGLVPGSEWGWGHLHIRTEPLEYGLDAYRIIAKQDINWDFKTLDLAKDTAEADETVGKIVNNYDPDLEPFFARGGKLIGFHGWSDPQTTPLSSIAYFNNVVKMVGSEDKVFGSYRLFLIPGLGHCGESGNAGVNTYDLLSALDSWSESGKPPTNILAARVIDGKVERTRPLCAYPQEAVYKGTGSTNDADNFYCAVQVSQ